MRFLRTLFVPAMLAWLCLPGDAFAWQPLAGTTFPSTLLTQNEYCNFLPQWCTGVGAGGVATVISTYFFLVAQYVFDAVAIIMFMQYGLRLMLESSDESTITEVKSAYTYGISGAALVSLATLVMQTVGQGFTAAPANSGSSLGASLINASAAQQIVHNIVTYIQYMVSTAVSGVVIYQGIRLILSQGQDSELDQQKKRFFHALLGVVVIILADTIIHAFVPAAGGGNGDANSLAIQIVGIVNFLLVILGGLSLLAFIISGVFLVVSTDEALKDRAKKAIFSTTVVLIIVLAIYAILQVAFNLPS